MTSNQSNDSSEHTKTQESVFSAQSRQRARNDGKLNAQLGSEEVKQVTKFRGNALALLERAAEKSGLSARGYIRVIKVAQTIADLSGETLVTETHVAEAVGLRSLDRLKRYVEGRA